MIAVLAFLLCPLDSGFGLVEGTVVDRDRETLLGNVEGEILRVISNAGVQCKRLVTARVIIPLTWPITARPTRPICETAVLRSRVMAHQG